LLDIDIKDKETGVNAFWLAAFYGHGDVMTKLAEHKIDTTNFHIETKSNALHVAVERQYLQIIE